MNNNELEILKSRIDTLGGQVSELVAVQKEFQIEHRQALEKAVKEQRESQEKIQITLTKIEKDLSFNKGQDTHTIALRNEERLTALESDANQAKGSIKTLYSLWVFLSAIIVALIVFYLTR